MHVTL